MGRTTLPPLLLEGEAGLLALMLLLRSDDFGLSLPMMAAFSDSGALVLPLENENDRWDILSDCIWMYELWAVGVCERARVCEIEEKEAWMMM
jgi:hypothetical protein